MCNLLKELLNYKVTEDILFKFQVEQATITTCLLQQYPCFSEQNPVYFVSCILNSTKVPFTTSHYLCNTVEPRSMDTRLIWTPGYY